MYIHGYRITVSDHIAKSFCESRNIVCEVFPTKTSGKIRVWVTFPDGRDFLRKKEHEKEDSAYAIYESYRAVAEKIFKKEVYEK